MKRNLSVLTSLILIFSFIACNRNNDVPGNNKANLQVRLTDSPDPNVKEVWVDIKDIQISLGDTGKWESLSNIYPGVYNLMDLTNGKDTILADALIPAGMVSQLRLILGDGNYIVTKDDVHHDLTTPSGQQSGLKVQVHQELTGGVLYRLILDFDAGKSVVKAGNSGKYNLKPVLRLISFVPSGGIIKGVVAPDTTVTEIFALMGLDTVASTFSDTASGNQYMFRDIPAGDYSLHYIPMDTIHKTAERAVNLPLGQVIMVDTVKLEPK